MDRVRKGYVIHRFRFPLPSAGVLGSSKVCLAGSWDNWETTEGMEFSEADRAFVLPLILPRGKYIYKFLVNGKDWLCARTMPIERDKSGQENNVLVIS